PTYDLATRVTIRERYVRPLGLSTPGATASDIARLAWHVGLLTHVVGEAAHRHPGWTVVTHAELCRDPQAEFRRLYTRLGLTWTPASARFVAEHDRSGGGRSTRRLSRLEPDRWRRRLTAGEMSDVEAVLSGFPRRGWVRSPEDDGR